MATTQILGNQIITDLTDIEKNLDGGLYSQNKDAFEEDWRRVFKKIAKYFEMTRVAGIDLDRVKEIVACIAKLTERIKANASFNENIGL